MNWVGLVEAPDETTAAMWCELLRGNGIPATPKLAGHGNYGGFLLGPLAPTECWVMVPEDDVDEARRMLEPIVEGKRPGRHRKRDKR
jgi:hypothetical protein